MKSINRRHFMVSATMATAAPFLSRAASVNGANDRIRVAVVGLKGRGRDHLRGYSNLSKSMNIEVAALCDVDENILNERLSEFEKKEGKRPVAATDVRKLLDDKSIDVVSYATPNHWHALETIWSCQAGKDVYVEKPASHNIWEGRKMVEAARRYDRVVQHGTQIRSSSAIQEAMEKLHEGVIGEVYMAKGLCYKWRDTIGKAPEEPVPAGFHYDLWTGPAPKLPFTRNRYHYNWHWQWAYGNGDIGNQGVHQLDVARWGLGVGLPKKVQSMGAHFMFDDDQETPNTLVSAFFFPDQKKMITFEVRHWISNPEGGIGKEREESNAVGVLFLGSEGYMEIPSYGAYRVFLGKKKEPGPANSGEGDHYANFIQAVRARKPNLLNAEIEEGHISTTLCHLANASYRLGRTLEFDPATERFVNDKDANKLLGRDYRKPYIVPEKV
ncbi:MAG: Gfo/Idh/MocA family oxidoreductase [Acidobacteriota bacterium]